MMQHKNSILTIIGPTAVGKTGLAIELAHRLAGEIIGLDSRQIYTGMAVGTAQPTPEEQSLVPHHLIAFRSPDQKITAGEFAGLVAAVVEDVGSRGKQPILCGGAGLYFRAISQGIFDASDSNLDIRTRLEQEYDELGAQALLDRITAVDSEYAAKIHPNNRKRLIRSLEIYEMTGQPPSVHFKQQPVRKYPFRLYSLLLVRPMEEIERRIRRRTEMMLRSGWLEETRKLMINRSSEKFHALDSIGYKEIADHLDGKISYDQMMALINLRTRQYAKRQLTWFKKEPIDQIVDMSEEYDVDNIIDRFIEANQQIPD